VITLQDPIAFSIAMTSSQIAMGPQRFKGQVPRSRNFLNRTCFWKMFMHEVFFSENFGSWRGTWRLKRCGPIAICEEGHCDGKMGWDPVRWTLLRIGVLPQSQRIGITFWYVCLLFDIPKSPTDTKPGKKSFLPDHFGEVEINDSTMLRNKTSTASFETLHISFPARSWFRFLHVRDFWYEYVCNASSIFVFKMSEVDSLHPMLFISDSYMLFPYS